MWSQRGGNEERKQRIIRKKKVKQIEAREAKKRPKRQKDRHRERGQMKESQRTK